MLNLLWLKASVLVILVATIAFGGYYIKKLQADNTEFKVKQEALTLRLNATEQSLASLDAIFVKRDEVNNDIRTNIADVTVRIKQEAARDPASRNFLTSPLPDGLRNAFIKDSPTPTNASNPGTNKPNPY